mgnify:CR=1 FL=1
MSKKFFSEDLTFIDCQAKDGLDLIEKAYPILLEKGKIKPTFLEAIITREKTYPTGLPTVPFGVAIPHGNPEHVVEPCMMLIRPKNPVIFHEMGNDENIVEAHFVVLMCLKREDSQVKTLSKLMDLFMNAQFMNTLLKCKDSNDIYGLFNSAFNF